jgi:hypothetical protein
MLRFNMAMPYLLAILTSSRICPDRRCFNIRILRGLQIGYALTAHCLAQDKDEKAGRFIAQRDPPVMCGISEMNDFLTFKFNVESILSQDYAKYCQFHFV